ncbi:NADP-dependent oxidoreductase domain-containing protein [Leptodontidium sp. MPI-SDFR-AT-0119]|nr:NADP-dependent oxidoreductase domain-containing protein [Leptodontidium sp. MPI-SDFR-AT-0119]
MAFTPAAVPKSILGYHRILSPTAGVRVSPLCLGAMNFGDAWKQAMGECSKETTFEILDYFFEQGGNFIDTANAYQGGESEQWIGEWMATRENREQIILATKYTTLYTSGKGAMNSNFSGNHSKSLKNSINASLKKLGTDYIDLFFVHWWDFTTSIPELMQSLNHLVAAGKILYLGISDTPAWVVVKANCYAREHGLTPFSVYQGKWNAATRDFERDILPMCESEGMGIAPWGVLGSGDFKTPDQREKDAGEGRKMFPPEEKNALVAGKLDEIARRKGTVLTSVALAYIMHKYPYVYPIIGGRKLSHLKGNIEALSIELTDEEIDEIEGVAEFDIGWPMNMLFTVDQEGSKYSSRMTSKDVAWTGFAAKLDVPEKLRAIRPRKLE